VLPHPSLLVVGEIGSPPVSHPGAVLVFRLMNRRYERAATVLTSNNDFEARGTVLGDEVMAAALIDPVLHRYHLVNIRGNIPAARPYRVAPDPDPGAATAFTGQAAPRTQGGSRLVGAAAEASRCAIFTCHHCTIFSQR